MYRVHDDDVEGEETGSDLELSHFGEGKEKGKRLVECIDE